MTKPTTSGQQSHICTKKDCYYCYYMTWLEEKDKPKPSLFKSRYWTEEDKIWLLENYDQLNIEEIKSTLQRSSSAIWTMIHQLRKEVAA